VGLLENYTCPGSSKFRVARPLPTTQTKPTSQTGGNRLTVRWRGHIVQIMRSGREHSIASAASIRELQVLEEVSHKPDVSQRQLADRLGVALGATNVLIRRLSDQGYIRTSKVGWRRWSYAITATGVSHKEALAQGVVKQFLRNYSAFRSVVKAELEEAGLSKRPCVSVIGSGDMTELVYLALTELGVAAVDFYAVPPNLAGKQGDESLADRELLGRSVRPASEIGPDKDEAIENEAIVVATAGDSSDLVTWLVSSGVSRNRVFAMSNGRFGDLTSHTPMREVF
jgi:DNA-binding MarR family transcriptional regulator